MNISLCETTTKTWFRKKMKFFTIACLATVAYGSTGSTAGPIVPYKELNILGKKEFQNTTKEEHMGKAGADSFNYAVNRDESGPGWSRKMHQQIYIKSTPEDVERAIKATVSDPEERKKLMAEHEAAAKALPAPETKQPEAPPATPENKGPTVTDVDD